MAKFSPRIRSLTGDARNRSPHITTNSLYIRSESLSVGRHWVPIFSAPGNNRQPARGRDIHLQKRTKQAVSLKAFHYNSPFIWFRSCFHYTYSTRLRQPDVYSAPRLEEAKPDAYAVDYGYGKHNGSRDEEAPLTRAKTHNDMREPRSSRNREQDSAEGYRGQVIIASHLFLAPRPSGFLGPKAQ